MEKKKITLEDGRYLIYFSFEKKDEKQDKEKTGCCGKSCCCGGKK